MKLLRTLPTGRLLFLLTAVGASAIAVVTAAVAIAGSGGSVPRSESLAQALHGALTADKPSGVSARIQFTNGLVPGSSLAQGQVGSALLTGASGRLWVTNDGRGRLELQSDAGDAQITWNGNQVSVYDASSNTVYRATLPARHESSTGTTDTQKTPPSVAEIQDALNRLALHADVSGATPTDVAGEPAYSVRVGPQDHSSLLGNAELAWDAHPRRSAARRDLCQGRDLAGARARRHRHPFRRRLRRGRRDRPAGERHGHRPLAAVGPRLLVRRRPRRAGRRARRRAGGRRLPGLVPRQRRRPRPHDGAARRHAATSRQQSRSTATTSARSSSPSARPATRARARSRPCPP